MSTARDLISDRNKLLTFMKVTVQTRKQDPIELLEDKIMSTGIGYARETRAQKALDLVAIQLEGAVRPYAFGMENKPREID